MSNMHDDTLIKIAVADDHTLFRESLCRMINGWDNCKVILHVGSGKQLIEQINEKHFPDLVLTDLRMPEMNGYDTMRILKNKYPQIKILVISMFESKDAIMLILKSGGHGFINKTANTNQLKNAVYEIMHRGYYFSDHTIMRIFKQVLDTGKTNMITNLGDEEIIFLKQICTENTYKKIAHEMGISERHTEYIRNSLFERFGLQSRTGLAIMSIEQGLVV